MLSSYEAAFIWITDEVAKPTNSFAKTFQASSYEEAKSEAESYRALLEEKYRTNSSQRLLLKSLK